MHEINRNIMNMEDFYCFSMACQYSIGIVLKTQLHLFLHTPHNWKSLVKLFELFPSFLLSFPGVCDPLLGRLVLVLLVEVNAVINDHRSAFTKKLFSRHFLGRRSSWYMV